MKNIQTKQIALGFAKALKEELSVFIDDQALIDKVINVATGTTLDLINALKQSHKDDLLKEVFSEIQIMAREGLAGEDVAFVLSSLVLTDDQKQSVENALKNRIGKEIKIRVLLDDTIKGGLLIRYKDMEINLTTESKLREYLSNLKK